MRDTAPPACALSIDALPANIFKSLSGLEFEYYSNDVQDSPIAREDFALEVELAMLYHF
jgi:hypothetical protein